MSLDGVDRHPDIETAHLPIPLQAAYAVKCPVCYAPPKRWCSTGLYRYVPIRSAPHDGRVRAGAVALEAEHERLFPK